MMRRLVSLTLTACLAVAGCATTEYKVFEAKNNVFEGRGGTKVVVDGMDIWDNGEPSRKFKVLGIIEDERPGGMISMARLRGDMVKKAREGGGDAVIQLNSQSQVAGYYTSGSATVSPSGTNAYGNATTTAVRRNTSKFAVIKYLD